MSVDRFIKVRRSGVKPISTTLLRRKYLHRVVDIGIGFYDLDRVLDTLFRLHELDAVRGFGGNNARLVDSTFAVPAMPARLGSGRELRSGKHREPE